MPTFEGLRLKVLKQVRIRFAEKRKKKLNNTDFTIISNNCWGGMIYESYNLKKASPTVGLYFSAADYIKFLKRLREYLSAPLSFVKSDVENCPVGELSLDDEKIQIVFLHYHSEEEAREKWRRRCERVNFDNMLVKFNDQNGCTEKELREFLELPYKNKVFFTCKNWDNIKDEKIIVKIKQFSRKNFILASYEPFGSGRYIDITALLNNLK